ncbi:MAG: hypothetical protein ACXVWF_05905 [Actinomycetota bacterium]
MQRLEWRDLASPGATLASGVTAGFVCGVLIGGVGGRLAMLLLRLTSDPTLRGVTTDDGFTIGRFSAETIFLLGVTSGLGMAGGLLYLIVRGWIPQRRRVLVMTVFFGLVGGGGLISPHGLDFNALGPLPLAVALFIAIPAAYGAAMPWLAERMLREGSAMRTRKWAWVAGLLPLALANIVGILVLVVAWVILVVGRAAPDAVAAWRSRATLWIGRALLVAAAVLGGTGLVRDSLEILA